MYLSLFISLLYTVLSFAMERAFDTEDSKTCYEIIERRNSPESQKVIMRVIGEASDAIHEINCRLEKKRGFVYSIAHQILSRLDPLVESLPHPLGKAFEENDYVIVHQNGETLVKAIDRTKEYTLDGFWKTVGQNHLATHIMKRTFCLRICYQGRK